MPITANMKIMMANTKVRLPRSPTALPMIDIRRLSVGQDLANLNTLNYMKQMKLVTEVEDGKP